jgi:hypothetical protein
MSYQAVATVVDDQWRVEVPDLGLSTSTSYLLRVEFEARRLIAEHLDIDPDSFDVEVNYSKGPARWTDPDGVVYGQVMLGRSGRPKYVPSIGVRQPPRPTD